MVCFFRKRLFTVLSKLSKGCPDRLLISMENLNTHPLTTAKTTGFLSTNKPWKITPLPYLSIGEVLVEGKRLLRKHGGFFFTPDPECASEDRLK